MEGSHAGAMRVAKSSWPLYREFAERMVPLLRTCIAQQLEAGADVVMMLDTAAGELPPSYFHREVVPDLTEPGGDLPGRVGYYAKAAHPAHFGGAMATARWAGIGVDSRWDLASLLAGPRARVSCRAISIPPGCSCPSGISQSALTSFLEPIAALGRAAASRLDLRARSWRAAGHAGIGRAQRSSRAVREAFA